MTQSLLEIDLPKWPAHLVTGTPVTIDQAKEIIRRLDMKFTQVTHDFEYDRTGLSGKFGFSRERGNSNLDWERISEWRNRWGILDIDFLNLDWVDSSYIGGPNGWCHHDGCIQSLKNIGKWPSVESVLKEWTIIAEAFPFLDLTSILGDREYSEEGLLPLVEFRVLNGKVSLQEPTIGMESVCQEERNKTLDYLKSSFRNDYWTPIPREWLEEWATKSRSILTEIDQSAKQESSE